MPNKNKLREVIIKLIEINVTTQSKSDILKFVKQEKRQPLQWLPSLKSILKYLCRN